MLPDIISSDLQQYNIVYPCLSLANVMSMFLKLGMPLKDVIERVTSLPAKAMSLAHRAGSLEVGRSADITVFDVEDGEFSFDDCYRQTRKGRRRFMPKLVFKAGRQIECDFARGKLESNWYMQVSEDSVPAGAARLSQRQRAFLRSLHDALGNTHWQGHTTEKGNAGLLLDVHDVYNLHDVFHRVLAAHPISMRDGAWAVLNCFLEHPFTIQIGLLLTRLDRRLVLDRLKAVTAPTAELVA